MIFNRRIFNRKKVDYQLDSQQENADILVAFSTGEFATGNVDSWWIFKRIFNWKNLVDYQLNFNRRNFNRKKMDYQLDFQQENLQQEKLVDYLLDFQQDSKSYLVSNRNSSFIHVRYIHPCWFLLVPFEIQQEPTGISF